MEMSIINRRRITKCDFPFGRA